MFLTAGAVRDWAAANKIGGRGPDDVLTREQLIAMLWQYMGTTASENYLERFSDRDMVSIYAVESIN